MAIQPKLGKLGWAKRLELLLEKLMWRFRLVAMLPVVKSLFSTLVAFILGTKSIVNSFVALKPLEGSGEHGDRLAAELLAGIVFDIDLYSIGISLMLTAFKCMLMMKAEGGQSLILFWLNGLLLALRAVLVTGHFGRTNPFWPWPADWGPPAKRGRPINAKTPSVFRP